MTPFAIAVLVAMGTISPVSAAYERLPGWEETPAQRFVRYQSIAADVAGAAEEACRGRGVSCETTSAGLLLGLAWHESGFAADVDAGKCYRGLDGKGPRCDSGLAWSIWQLRTAGEEAQLFASDRKAAARAALRRARQSMGACRALPPELRLAAYAGGRCEGAHADAYKRSRELTSLVARATAELARAIAQ